jgi:hypothetical protein
MWPGREADHSPPSSAEVKNAWSYTSTPQYVFMALYLFKQRGNFNFPFIILGRIDPLLASYYDYGLKWFIWRTALLKGLR